jgi:hypothetical protein
VVKVLLLSVVLATVVIPVLCARTPHPVKGMKRLLFFSTVYFILFVLAVKYVYPRIVTGV